MDGYGACRNCTGTDYLVDTERGECTCASCGCVNADAVLMVASARYKELYDCNGNRQFQAPLVETLRGGVYSETASDYLAQQVAQTTSAPYQRATYFAERISQWRGLEPSIDTSDFADIRKLYHRYTNKWGLYPEQQRWEPDYCLSKEDTRQLLWEIDRQRVKDGMKPYFVKKYLVSCLCSCIYSTQVAIRYAIHAYEIPHVRSYFGVTNTTAAWTSKHPRPVDLSAFPFRVHNHLAVFPCADPRHCRRSF